MARNTRDPRDSKIPPKVFLKPFDAMAFGSKDDPCFGKLYDLTTDECQACGDLEVCAIAFTQNLQIKRAELERDNKFKDLEEQELIAMAKAREYIKRQRKLKIKDSKIAQRVEAKFGLSKETIKTLL